MSEENEVVLILRPMDLEIKFDLGTDPFDREQITALMQAITDVIRSFHPSVRQIYGELTFGGGSVWWDPKGLEAYGSGTIQATAGEDLKAGDLVSLGEDGTFRRVGGDE